MVRGTGGPGSDGSSASPSGGDSATAGGAPLLGDNLRVDTAALRRGARAYEDAGASIGQFGSAISPTLRHKPLIGPPDRTWRQFEPSYMEGTEAFLDGVAALADAVTAVADGIEAMALGYEQTEETNEATARNALGDSGSGAPSSGKRA